MRAALAVSISCSTVCLAGCGGAPATQERAAQQSPADRQQGRHVPDGIDPKQTSDDPTYGYTKGNPIKVGGPKGSSGPASERLYLRHLRDAHFKPFTFRRQGSVGAGPDGHILDMYELVSSDGNKHLLYIDMYHPDVHPFHVKAPHGMYFWK